ncbi:hypothetical protein BI012_gp49 [Acinetobacter phage LZ35]|uniref:Uncharacterized protein n=1 Tax=Acinetobacter phage LZ35 TaxID=1792222 RepID=A0A1B2RD81_9CAUD|nr:hypothetical protein BI012_gp49 [Acinetobacter phage LZ35]AOB43400.1 hypothetical protein YD_49 [Acinetobacter phage LZ35]
MKNELELLKSICEQQVLNLMNKCEWNTFPKYRKVEDYEIRLTDVCLWHMQLWTSSKRRYVANKLEKLGILEVIKRRSYSPVCVRFIDEKYNLFIFDLCQKSLIGFKYISGNGWNSYPQYTKTTRGESEISRISNIIYNQILQDFNLH